MNDGSDSGSRRDFVTGMGALVSAVAVGAAASSVAAAQSATPTPAAEWDLGWIPMITRASDRAIFDWPSLGDPADAIVLQIAERYLDNCKAVYQPGTYDVRVVLNIRTQAVPAALSDSLWERFALGTEYNVKDPNTKEAATRNPFWHRAPSPVANIVMPTLADLMQRGAIVLVCDFALGHLARRLAPKFSRTAEEVHRELRAGFVSGAAYAVPSGFFALARAQNSGCAYIRI